MSEHDVGTGQIKDGHVISDRSGFTFEALDPDDVPYNHKVYCVKVNGTAIEMKTNRALTLDGFYFETRDGNLFLFSEEALLDDHLD